MEINQHIERPYVKAADLDEAIDGLYAKQAADLSVSHSLRTKPEDLAKWAEIRGRKLGREPYFMAAAPDGCGQIFAESIDDLPIRGDRITVLSSRVEGDIGLTISNGGMDPFSRGFLAGSLHFFGAE